MKSLIILITLFIQINLHYALNYDFSNARNGLYDYVLHLSNVDISKKCDFTKENKTCIHKCCPDGQIFKRFKMCVPSTKVLSNVTVYNEKLSSTNKSLSGFKLVPQLMLDDATFSRNSLWWHRNAYLMEDGKLLLKFPNVYNRWKTIDVNHFCVEMKMNDTEARPVFLVEYSIKQFKRPTLSMQLALIVSTICLILTFLVYAILPQLRDLNGIIVMFYLACLIIATIVNSCLEGSSIVRARMSEIMTLTFLYYFFKVCSICWTNVMFYRILKTSEPEDEPESTIKELIKYSAYAIGLPFFMTSVVAAIEVSDMTDTPWFVTPQIRGRGNLNFQEIESVYYLYIPTFLLLSYNWIVSIMKAVVFCNTHRQFTVVSTEDATKAETNFNRPMKFVKISSILTILTILETLTAVYPKAITFDISALYSICIGPIIMVILICSTAVKNLLVQRLQEWRTGGITNSFGLTTMSQSK